MGLFSPFRNIFGKHSQNNEAPQTRIEIEADPHDHTPAVERRTRKRVNAREGTRVLVIDDSTTVVAMFKKILRSAGYVTLEALDAEHGIEIAQTERPELIFLDIVLPGMNGFAALRQLRRDPITKDIPIIMISGNEQATEKFFGSRIGADDFMKKPFSRLEIFARIERLLDEDLVPRRIILPTQDDDPTAQRLV